MELPPAQDRSAMDRQGKGQSRRSLQGHHKGLATQIGAAQPLMFDLTREWRVVEGDAAGWEFGYAVEVA